MNVVEEIFRAIVGVWGSLDEIRNNMDQSKIHGPVCDVDAKKQRCRIVVGLDSDGEEVKSPWLPYNQIAGTRKVHSPPSKGQTMTMYSPNGDHDQSVAVPYTFSEKNPSPSEDPDADVEVRGKTRRTQKDASYTEEVDGMTRTVTKQSKSLTIHKDPETKEEGKDEEVSDAKPWKGNRAKPLHNMSVNKKGGYSLTINVEDKENEHKITYHPEEGFTLSFGKEKHVVKVNKDEISHSFDKGKHKTLINKRGIKNSVDDGAHEVEIKGNGMGALMGGQLGQLLNGNMLDQLANQLRTMMGLGQLQGLLNNGQLGTLLNGQLGQMLNPQQLSQLTDILKAMLMQRSLGGAVSGGIFHKTSMKLTIDAQQIEHNGDMKVNGSVMAKGSIHSQEGVAAPIMSGAPGMVPPPTNW